MTSATPQPNLFDMDSATTPMMAQYFAIKEKHEDCLLFYRLGDFYELFFDDAIKAASALDIALTKRGKHKGEDVPLCGVPVHAAENYLSRLIRQGFRVAIVEQMEDPAAARKRGSKAVVARDVVRVVTPGTLIEDSFLDARKANYLAALASIGAETALAWCEITTGEFAVEYLAVNEVSQALSRIDPGELLIMESLLAAPDWAEVVTDYRQITTPLPAERFRSQLAETRLMNYFKVGSLDGFGDFRRCELAAAGALLSYLEVTQAGRMPDLSPPRRFGPESAMIIDPATRRNLELTESSQGGKAGSLLAAIDRCLTGAGARLLASRLSAPLRDPAEISARLDSIDWLLSNPDRRQDLRGFLRKTPDLARAYGRLALGRGGPRDLSMMGHGLTLTLQVKGVFGTGSTPPPSDLLQAIEELGEHTELGNELLRALIEDPPVHTRDGGFICKGYAPELDECLRFRDEGRRLIAALEARYRQETKVESLKIKHNNILGYHIEIPARHAERMDGAAFTHRQTMASSVRYDSPELNELAAKILEAGERALAIEQALFDQLRDKILADGQAIQQAANGLARIDLAAGLAELAAEQDYCRPVLADDNSFLIEEGRHPVVEPALKREDGAFITNHCDLGEEQRLWLLTGPNMAGKSTFLRQNALIALLAQAGSYVPAKQAKIGIIDRLFSRVGAADDIARGRSTFMVEMVETAAILNLATPRSLVILDEIGRGTATFDGLSIAWATVEYLHDQVQCRAMFATHYHELNALVGTLGKLRPMSMKVREWKGEVIFLHTVVQGAADQSYGIHVARLAGLPAVVVDRSRMILSLLNEGEANSALAKLTNSLPLFAESQAKKPEEPPAWQVFLDTLDPDQLSPRDAQDALYQLKNLWEKKDLDG